MLVAVQAVLFFFFQAEDGIRDGHVTGVQTCALPISTCGIFTPIRRKNATRCRTSLSDLVHGVQRSEERRVGKECGCRWGPFHYNDKAIMVDPDSVLRI